VIQFQDVVVPAGLRLIDGQRQSHSVEAASYRHAHYLYSGTVRPEEAIGYVRLRMPQHKWQLAAEEEVDENTVRLRFVRGQYSADYSFTYTGGVLQMVVDYKTDYSAH